MLQTKADHFTHRLSDPLTFVLYEAPICNALSSNNVIDHISVLCFSCIIADKN